MFFVALFFVALVILLPFAVPVWLWSRHASESRRLWAPQQVGTQRLDAGSYREVEVPVYGEAGAPMAVRVAALGAWGLGTMFVPGLMLGLFGLSSSGVGLVSVPGLMLAARLFRLGAPLLRGDSEAVPRARAAARFAVVLNIFVMAASLFAGSVLWHEFHRDRGNATSIMILPILFLVLMVMAYATLSFVHAWYLRRAAEVIEAKCAARATEQPRTGVRLDAAPSEQGAAVGAGSVSAADVFVDPLAARRHNG